MVDTLKKRATHNQSIKNIEKYYEELQDEVKKLKNEVKVRDTTIKSLREELRRAKKQ